MFDQKTKMLSPPGGGRTADVGSERNLMTEMSQASSARPCSRRTVLRMGLTAAVLGPLLSACGGADTSGAGGGAGSVVFLSTQFAPVEDRQKYEATLRRVVPDQNVAFNPVDAGVFATTITSQARAGRVELGLVGGLHGDLATVAPHLEDLSELLASLGDRGYPKEMLELATLGTGTTRYIPWMQATYVVAVNKRALEWLPSGVDVNDLTYDGFLDWARAAKNANGGKAVFGFPAGPGGLHHRFYQGYLLPSFTGGQITTFRSPDAVTAWEYMRELWRNMTPASTNYEFMQEPLASGEVLVAWDHVARLPQALAAKPDDFVVVPAPRGPKGRGYMLVVAGLAIPTGSPVRQQAEAVIRALAGDQAQIETLRANAFFPVTDTPIPDDLPPAVALQARAVQAQQNHPTAIVSLPPVGLGERDGEVSQLFKNCFKSICLDGAPIQPTLDSAANQLNAILGSLGIPCWAPDPVGQGTCMVA